MFIELLDLLRCVKPHEDTWLVASFKTVSNRFVREGTLGCPSCSASYSVTEGVGDFSLGGTVAMCEAERAAVSHRREEMATRAGAYLNATEPGATIVLGGVWAYAAQELAELSDVKVIALNAPEGVKEFERVGLVRIAARIPLAESSVLGVALDAWFPDALVDSAINITRPGGRIVGPSTLPPPAELTVLAHDDRYWVGQKAEQTVPLRRAGR